MGFPRPIAATLSVAWLLVGFMSGAAGGKLREQCRPDRLTETRLAEILASIEGSETPASRLTQMRELFGARDTVAWRRHLIVDLARAHEAAGTLGALLGELEAGATDAGAAALPRATAALLRSVLASAMLDAEAAHRWARQAAEIAPLDALGFWQASLGHLRSIGAIDPKFMERVMAEPSMPGFMRIGLLLQIQNYVGFDTLFTRWLHEHPDEFGEALKALYTCTGSLPQAPLRSALDAFPAPDDPVARLRLKLIEIDLALLDDKRAIILPDLWEAFELAGALGGSTVVGSELLRRTPSFSADAEDPWQRVATDRQVTAGSETFASSAWHHYHNHPGPLDARGVRLRCLGLIAARDGDGVATANRLEADTSLETASLPDRIAHFWAAGLHRSMADELSSATARAATAHQLNETLCYLSYAAMYDLSIFAAKATEIGWRLGVLDSCLEFARRIRSMDPDKLPFAVTEIHGGISYYLGFQPYTQTPLHELIQSWQDDGGGDPATCTSLLRRLRKVGPNAMLESEGVPRPDPAPLPSQRVLPQSEISYLSREISAQERYFRERFQERNQIPSRSMRMNLSYWFYGREFGSQAEALAALDEAGIARLSPIQRQRTGLAELLFVLRDLEDRPGLDLAEARKAALDRIRELIGGSPDLAPFELVAAQWLMGEVDPDWETVGEIALRHVGSDLPAARTFATHLRGIVASAEGRDAESADLKASVAAAFRPEIDQNTYFGGYKNRGWSRGEPDRGTSPAAWLFWASRTLTETDDKPALARQMLRVFAISSREDGSVTEYQNALVALQESGELEAVMGELEKLAMSGDRAAANVLFSVAGGDFTDITRIEAAGLLCAATDDSYQAQLVLLEDARDRRDHEAAYSRWLLASSHDAVKATRAIMKEAATLPDKWLLRLCETYATTIAGFPHPPADTSAGNLLAAELLRRESTREVGLQRIPTLFSGSPGGSGASSLIDHLIYEKVDSEAVGGVARSMLWPSFLAGIGLTPPGTPARLRQDGRSEARRIMAGHGRTLLPPVIAEADARGELGALHEQASVAIEAGLNDASLFWFDFRASLLREPPRAPAALVRLHSYQPDARLRSSSRYRRTMDPEMSARVSKSNDAAARAKLLADLPLLPDDATRRMVVSGLIHSRGAQTPTWLLDEGIAMADQAGDKQAAAEFRELAVEQAITTDLSAAPARVMHQLIRRGDKERASQLFGALAARCGKTPALILDGEGRAMNEFLESGAATDRELFQQRLAWMIQIARKIESPRGRLRFPSQLWDIAVRHGLEHLALPLLHSSEFNETPAGFHASLSAIRQIGNGAPKNRQVFARVLPDANGHAVVHWDLAAGRATDIVRHRFPLDKSELRTDLTIKIEARELDAKIPTEIPVPNATPRGKLVLSIPIQNCTSVQVTTKKLGHPGEKDLSCEVAAFGENRLLGELENEGTPSAGWDPCGLELSYSGVAEGQDNPDGHLYFPIAAPVPMDQIMRVHFETWLRIDAPGYSPLGPNAERVCQFGFLLLDGDQKPLARPNFSYIRGQKIEIGGAWTFANFSEHLSNLRHKQPKVAWIQFVIAWPDSSDLRGQINLTLGDPWLSFTRGQQLVSNIPEVDRRLEISAIPLTTQAIRDSDAMRAGLPAATPDGLQIYVGGELDAELDLPSPPRDAFVLSVDRSHIAICEDDSIWRWRRGDAERIGELPAPAVDGPSVIVASPDGRRAVRLINTPAGPVAEVFKVTRRAFTPIFSCDLRPLELTETPSRIGFDPAGRFVLGCGRQEVEVSLIDHSHRILEREASRGMLPSAGLGWDERAGSVVGIARSGTNNIVFQRPAQPSPARRILWADAAFLNPESGEITTIEHGWFRRWTEKPPGSR